VNVGLADRDLAEYRLSPDTSGPITLSLNAAEPPGEVRLDPQPDPGVEIEGVTRSEKHSPAAEQFTA